MTRTYAYVLTDDNGSAPCAPDALLTLGICKSKVRSKAKPGDRLVGFSGKTIATRTRGRYSPNCVIYAAVIDRVYPWRQYKGPEWDHRMDCIYAFSELDGKPYRKENATVHFKKEDLEHDLQGPVLLCRDFRYFGENAVPLSTVSIHLEELSQAMGRGHRVFHPAQTQPHKQVGLLEFDKLFRGLWQRSTSYTLPVAGSVGNQPEDDPVQDSSNQDRPRHNIIGHNRRSENRQRATRNRGNAPCSKRSPTRSGRVFKGR